KCPCPLSWARTSAGSRCTAHAGAGITCAATADWSNPAPAAPAPATFGSGRFSAAPLNRQQQSVPELTRSIKLNERVSLRRCRSQYVERMWRAGRSPHFAASPAGHGSRSARAKELNNLRLALTTFALQLDAFEARLKSRSSKTTVK